MIRGFRKKRAPEPRTGFALVDYTGQFTEIMNGDPRLTLASVRIYKSAPDGTWVFDKEEPLHIGTAYLRDPQTGRFIPTKPA